MKDRFVQLSDQELNLIWEALSAFDPGPREGTQKEVRELFQEALPGSCSSSSPEEAVPALGQSVR